MTTNVFIVPVNSIIQLQYPFASLWLVANNKRKSVEEYFQSVRTEIADDISFSSELTSRLQQTHFTYSLLRYLVCMQDVTFDRQKVT